MKRKKGIAMLLVIMFILATSMVSVSADPYACKLFVDPPTYTATRLGEVFTINISVTNVYGLSGYQFRLGYNTTLLDAIEIVEGPFPNPPISSIGGINETEGTVWIMVTCNPTEGNGTLATVTFNSTYAESASCTLDLYDTVLSNIYGDPILHDAEDGNYQFAILTFTVTTDKPAYNLGENITIQGNLTLDSSPYQRLVGLKVADPSYPIVFRTIEMGTPPPGDIAILDVFPCDFRVIPKYSFSLNEFAYFNAEIRNNGTETKNVTIAINAYDGDMVPLGAPMQKEESLGPGNTINVTAAILIPDWAYIGTGTVYVSAFTDFIRKGGVPYCPEKSTTFNITNGSGGAGKAPEAQVSETAGNYSLTFKLPPQDPYIPTGIYRVHATILHKGQSITCNTVFGVNAICVPNQYATIQAAVNAANSTHNSIIVVPETYNEHVTINKTVTLVGKDPSNTIINGSGIGTVVTITADNVEISRFTIQNSGSSFSDSGIALSNSAGSTISENIVLENNYGVYVNSFSQENIIRGNTITSNNGYGIMINSSDNNTIRDNTLSTNNYGIYINHSTGTTLKDNNMICNKYNFGVFGDSLSDFTHDIDASNTVDGKPIYYWIDQQGEIPSNAGFVAIISFESIVVKGLNLTKNAQGVLLAFTNDSIIERVNTINNDYGIYMINSNNNTIIGGTLSNNSVGIYQRNSNENIICHNNFINNINQVDRDASTNTWNDGAENGNYWSDYNGTDTDGDGIGDTELPWQGVDSYPLIDPWILINDIAIISVTPVLPYNVTEAFPGWIINITVALKNKGDFTEAFNVSAFYNETAITLPNGKNYTAVNELTPLAETAINLTWDTQGISPGIFTISAEASTVPDETNTTDNILINGQVKIRLWGDIDGKGNVNIYDMLLLKIAITLDKTGEEEPFCDVNGDGKVTIYDMLILKIIITLAG